MSGRRPTISACMIVQDEERRLAAALDSLEFCDEVVLVDGGSRDGTVELARSMGAKVIQSPWPGFAAQRNVALDAAASDWVIELDADERVSSELRKSIERLLAQADADVEVAVCPLRNRFLGGWLGPSAKYPAYRTRVFRKGAYRHDETRQVHEGIEPRERPAILDGDLQHELASSWREALGDAWRYARLESAHLDAPRAPGPYLVGILLRPLVKLAYRLLLDGGWRDGWRGLAKVGLDTGSDSLVWTLALGRALKGGAQGQAPAVQSPGSEGQAQPAVQSSAGEGQVPVSGGPPATGGHFGRRPAGPAKVIALAASGAPARQAAAWLGPLAAAGLDVVLVSDDGAPAGPAVPLRRARLTPLATLRALDVEMQLRTAHALVAFGTRAKLLCRLLPGALRPQLAGVEAGADPAQALAKLQALSRSS